MDYKIPVTYHMTDEDLENIIITALEGGIGYWACLDNDNGDFRGIPEGIATSEWCWQILKNGGSLHFFDEEDDDAEFSIDLQSLIYGIGKTISETAWDGDINNVDAVVADIIIQYAVFDDVIYG